MKAKEEFIRFFKIVLGKIASACKELNKFCPPNRSDDLCLFFCIYPSSMTLPIYMNYLFKLRSDEMVLQKIIN